ISGSGSSMKASAWSSKKTKTLPWEGEGCERRPERVHRGPLTALSVPIMECGNEAKRSALSFVPSRIFLFELFHYCPDQGSLLIFPGGLDPTQPSIRSQPRP